MTKRVRIENADTSNYKVMVEVWEKGDYETRGEDHKISQHELKYPAEMQEFYIHSGRYLIVRESGTTDKT